MSFPATITDTRPAAERALVNAEYSRRILDSMSGGASVAEALDAILGAGTYERLAGELYDALRARAVARGETVCAPE